MQNIDVYDNGAAYMLLVDGMIVSRFSTLADAWAHIKWMHDVATQSFTVGKKQVPVNEWVAGMSAAGYID